MKNVVLTISAFLSCVLVSFSAFAGVNTAERVLVVVSELQEHGPQNLRGLYTVLEELTGVQTQVILGASYGRIIYLKRDQATLANFRSTLLGLAANNSIKAIDVIMSLHGGSGRLYFREGRVNVEDMTQTVVAASTTTQKILVSKMKQKLRAIYNLSCFGRSHNQAFRDMGFDITVGSNGVNANSEVEFTAVLASWKFGSTFKGAFDATNSNFAIQLADAPVQFAGINADSKKYFRGSSTVKITSDAL